MLRLGRILEEIRLDRADINMCYKRVEKIIRKHMDNDGWIPVWKRLPTEEEQKKDYGDFIVTIWSGYKTSKPFVSRAYFNGDEFELQEKDYSAFREVIAWQPLPEPYRQDKE